MEIPHERTLGAAIARAAQDIEQDLTTYDELAPELAVWDETVTRVSPELSPQDHAERTLRLTLAALHRELAPDTFAALRERLAARAPTLPVRATAPSDVRVERATLGLAPIADAPRRSFHDSTGRIWFVQETPAAPGPWARGPRCLVFASEHAIRRVWRYPVDWASLDDRGLESLSWGV